MASGRAAAARTRLHEFVLVPALRQRAEVALAVAAEVLDMNR